jgi:IS5 family transposase
VQPEPTGVTDDQRDSGEAVVVRIKDPKEVPSTSLQNPSDPDSTYSGHKGQGYHVQVMETCAETKDDSGETPLNLITHVHVEGADVHDGKALLPAIANTERIGLKPETVLCDTAYGSDDNVLAAKDAGVAVVSPVGGSDPEVGKVRLADFKENEEGLVESCPIGQKPWCQTKSEKGVVTSAFDPAVCKHCHNADKCPALKTNGKAELRYTPKDMRLSKRRSLEQTDRFKKQYGMRAGIEATNSCLDRVTGFKHSRYRGISKLKMSLVFKIIALNFLRYVQKCRKTMG